MPQMSLAMLGLHPNDMSKTDIEHRILLNLFFSGDPLTIQSLGIETGYSKYAIYRAIRRMGRNKFKIERYHQTTYELGDQLKAQMQFALNEGSISPWLNLSLK
jgi:hypothetical protein